MCRCCQVSYIRAVSFTWHTYGQGGSSDPKIGDGTKTHNPLEMWHIITLLEVTVLPLKKTVSKLGAVSGAAL